VDEQEKKPSNVIDFMAHAQKRRYKSRHADVAFVHNLNIFLTPHMEEKPVMEPEVKIKQGEEK
jgi:hypothetical protein